MIFLGIDDITTTRIGENNAICKGTSTLRATTKIHLGQIGEDVLEDDIIEFDGQTLKMGGHEHQLSALKGAVKAGWFVIG